jgi:hypothetical protein
VLIQAREGAEGQIHGELERRRGGCIGPEEEKGTALTLGGIFCKLEIPVRREAREALQNQVLTSFSV